MAQINKPVQEVNQLEKLRGFWAQYSKPVTYIGTALVVLIIGFAVYKYMVLEPKNVKANDAVFVTQQYFEEFTGATDSSKALLAAKVLNGDGVNPGALKIMNDYSGSEAANLCAYYTGACYLHLGQFDKSLTYLKDFDAHGATQIQSRSLGMMGDASAELNKNDDALSYYKKAASVNEKDDFTSSEFLFKAALFAETTGKTKEAVDLFKKLKTNYPGSEKAADADRYLAKLGEFSE